MVDIAYDEELDITDRECPLTFVKAKVTLDELDEGEVLKIRLNDGEPRANVPRSLADEGHEILSLDPCDDGTYLLYVRKGAD